MTKIISYNVNGIRAAMRKDFIPWLSACNADIVCLQELKANPEQFDERAFRDLGYHCYWFPAEKKGYSGVAILSKVKPEDVICGTGDPSFDIEGRIIQAKFKAFTVLSTYHPSGSSGGDRLAYKFKWMEYFKDFIGGLNNDSLIIAGDFNICHQPIDIHNPVANKKSSGFLPEERAWLDEFMKSGYVDAFRKYNQEPHQYTWWSYRTRAREKNLGWRIDYHLVSSNLEDKIINCRILSAAKHSDHCPILLEMEV